MLTSCDRCAERPAVTPWRESWTDDAPLDVCAGCFEALADAVDAAGIGAQRGIATGRPVPA